MKVILFFLGRLFSFVISMNLVIMFRYARSYFYTGWITPYFREMKGFVNYPIRITGGRYVVVNEGVIIGKNSILSAKDNYQGELFSPSIIIGKYTRIGEETHITAISNIVIGKGVQTGRRVLISDNSHGNTKQCLDSFKPVVERRLFSKGGVFIGDNVWIGDNVVILSGVSIGDRAVIGANAVVTKDVPADTVFAGVPAKEISNK